MPAALTPDEIFAELAGVTTLTASEWQDVLACTPEQQALILQGYRDQDWVQSPDKLAKVLAILAIVGTIAGVVTGVASAAAALRALKG